MDGSPKESLPACSGLRRHGLFALSGVRAGGSAEDHAVGDGVAAEAVGAVDAARRFTGGVEAFNGFAVLVKNLKIIIERGTVGLRTKPLTIGVMK